MYIHKIWLVVGTHIISVDPIPGLAPRVQESSAQYSSPATSNLTETFC